MKQTLLAIVISLISLLTPTFPALATPIPRNNTGWAYYGGSWYIWYANGNVSGAYNTATQKWYIYDPKTKEYVYRQLKPWDVQPEEVGQPLEAK